MIIATRYSKASFFSPLYVIRKICFNLTYQSAAICLWILHYSLVYFSWNQVSMALRELRVLWCTLSRRQAHNVLSAAHRIIILQLIQYFKRLFQFKINIWQPQTDRLKEDRDGQDT